MQTLASKDLSDAIQAHSNTGWFPMLPAQTGRMLIAVDLVITHSLTHFEARQGFAFSVGLKV
jgi:hypothetical protein